MRGRELALLLPLLVLYAAAALAFPAHPDDEASYVTLAERLTHGAYVTGDEDALLDADPTSPDLWFGPGLPAVLAPLVALDAPMGVLRATGPVLLLAAVLLFYVLARDRWGPRVGLGAAYALGLYPPFWALLPNLHSEPLAILFLVAGMLGLGRYVDGGGAASFALGAGSLAGLALTRVAYGWVLTLVLAALALWWLVARSRSAARAAPVVAVALLLCVPWLAYTYAQTDRILQWGNSGSLSLYWMASPYEGDLGDWRQADDVFDDPALAPHRPFFRSLAGLPLAEQNAELEREALRNIAGHPERYAENLVANLSRLLFNTPYSEEPPKANDAFYALPNSLVVGALALSLLVLVPRRRELPPEALPFVLLGSAGLALHVAVATYPRMLMPLVPIVVWFAVLSLLAAGVFGRDEWVGAPRGTREPSRDAAAGGAGRGLRARLRAAVGAPRGSGLPAG